MVGVQPVPREARDLNVDCCLGQCTLAWAHASIVITMAKREGGGMGRGGVGLGSGIKMMSGGK